MCATPAPAPLLLRLGLGLPGIVHDAICVGVHEPVREPQRRLVGLVARAGAVAERAERSVTLADELAEAGHVCPLRPGQLKVWSVVTTNQSGRQKASAMRSSASTVVMFEMNVEAWLSEVRMRTPSRS